MCFNPNRDSSNSASNAGEEDGLTEDDAFDDNAFDDCSQVQYKFVLTGAI